MTPQEALDYTLSVVHELGELPGVSVEIKKWRNKQNLDPHQQSSIAKYSNRIGGVGFESWCNVDFILDGKTFQSSVDQIFKTRAEKLSSKGIYFDSGGGMGVIDWELDWSFRYDPEGTIGEIDAEFRKGMMDIMNSDNFQDAFMTQASDD